MPEGKDPDDFIKENGKDGLLNLLKEKEKAKSKNFVLTGYSSIQNSKPKIQNQDSRPITPIKRPTGFSPPRSSL